MGVVVVTGGASGIGFALASMLGNGDDQVLIADRDRGALDEAVEQLRERGRDAHGFVVDVRDRRMVDQLADAATDLGEIATVCLNAGVSSTGPPTWATPTETFDFVFDVNLRGLVFGFEAFIPRLIEQGSPASVVVTASMAGLVTSPTSGAYSASKAAAIALTKALRGELASTAQHIAVVLLAPGMVRTNLQRTSAVQLPALIPDDMVEATHLALNQLGVEPEEAARWVANAIECKRFWAVPPSDDVFAMLLAAELSELEAAIRG